jgi:adenylate kinase family enzyme
MAETLASRLGARHVELDSLFHLPNWAELPVDEFRRQVAELSEDDSWVVDGNYSTVRDLVWTRADAVVWVDPPRSVVMRRVIFRSLARVIFRRELWNANRERWRYLLSADPAKSIIVWAWTQHQAYRDRYSAAMTDPCWAHLTFIRLRSASDAEDFLSSVGCRTQLESDAGHDRPEDGPLG